MIEYVIIGILAVINLLLIVFWPKTKKIEDIIPENPTDRSCGLKLQNEGGKYVKRKNGKIYLKIVK